MRAGQGAVDAHPAERKLELPPPPASANRGPADAKRLDNSNKKLYDLAWRWLHVPAIAQTRREEKYKYLQYRGLGVEEIDSIFLHLCPSFSLRFYFFLITLHSAN